MFVLLLLAPRVAYGLRHWLHGVLARQDGRLAQKGVTMLESLPDRPTRLFGTLFWAWANWLVKLGALGWVLAALAPVGLVAGMLGAIGGDLTTVLPVHAPGGFGTYEAGLALLLAPLVDEPRTVLAAAVNLHLFVLGTALLAAALAPFIRCPAPR